MLKKRQVFAVVSIIIVCLMAASFSMTSRARENDDGNPFLLLYEDLVKYFDESQDDQTEAFADQFDGLWTVANETRLVAGDTYSRLLTMDPKLDALREELSDVSDEVEENHGETMEAADQTLTIVKALETLLGQGLVGEVDGPASLGTTGKGWSWTYTYEPPGEFAHPKKFSLWISLALEADDVVEFEIKYAVGAHAPRLYSSFAFSGPLVRSILLVDELPVAGMVQIDVSQTAGDTTVIHYHAIIEEH